MPNDDAKRLVAACFASLEEAITLLQAEPHLLHARTGLGETPLHYLTVENQLRAVQLLADHGAEVNTVNKCGGTPLSEAASLGHVALVSYLLSHGATLSVSGQEEPTLHSAVRSGNPQIVSLILGAGANIEEADDISQTAIHIAAESDDRVSVLRLLLEAGASASARRIFDQTPLDVATASGSQACIAVLTAHLAAHPKPLEDAP
jgi:ankyrin repeat protein